MLAHKLVRRALTAIILALLAGAPSGLRAEELEAGRSQILDRIVMIGASATAGFTIKEPFGGTNTQFLKLDRYLDAAIKSPHQPVQNFGTAMFFTKTDDFAGSQVARAQKQEPSLVVAVDFLFWFGYGHASNDVQRIDHFECGLKFLEDIPCPLVVGDIPDASGAVGKILSADEVPSKSVLTTINARLTAWAGARTNVVVVPLANFMRAAVNNEAVPAKHNTFRAGTTSRMLQPDGLHPTAAGCSTLALAILEAIEANQNISQDVNWNAEAIEQEVAEAVRKAQQSAATNRIPASMLRQANGPKEAAPAR